MDKGFDDFRAGEADVPRGVDVDVQLFFAAALRGECGQRYQLTLAQVERRAVVDFTKGEADDVLPQSGAMSASAVITASPCSPSMVFRVAWPRCSSSGSSMVCSLL